MRQSLFLSIIFSCCLVLPGKAQRFDQLAELKDHSVKAYYSPGHEQRARAIVQRVDSAMMFNERLLGFHPEVTLLILDTADWITYDSSKAVYGMPHYNNDKTLIVAAEDNVFWSSFLPPLAQLPPGLRAQVLSVYGNGDSAVSMRPFFDLLAIHELGHAFFLQSRLLLQRKWMGELFANMLLHAYIAEREPASLPALTLFPQMVVGGGTKGLTYTSLADIELRYNEIGRQYPKNYGWYQCRWHMAAAGIYDAGGKEVCRKLWEALRKQQVILADAALSDFLAKEADRSVADMMKNWDRNMVK